MLKEYTRLDKQQNGQPQRVDVLNTELLAMSEVCLGSR